ncbi:MAG: ParB N-terminal domain-containing protein [Desulfotalea sp.]
MKCKIEKIKVDETKRLRQDNGDLESLRLSIEKVGLLQPLVVDEHYNLIAGFRRYTVCKELGIKEINVHLVECGGDKHKLLDLELAENIGRKNFTEEELASEAGKREAIDKELRGTPWQRCCNWFKSLFK